MNLDSARLQAHAVALIRFILVSVHILLDYYANVLSLTSCMTFRILMVWSVKENAAELERRQSLQPSSFHSLSDL